MTRLLRSILLCAPALLAACGGGGGGTSTQVTGPQANLSTTSIAAGPIAVGASTSKTVTLTNGGNATLTISGITISGTNSASFSSTDNCGSSVAASASCVITIVVAPTTAGNLTATLSIATNAPGSPATVSLTATGANNILPVTVDAGPASLSQGSVNLLYATIRVCTPGSTTQCQTIDHIQVDTGSTGLRLFKSVVTGATGTPIADSNSGLPVFECLKFADGYITGSVARLDVTIGSRTVLGLPVHLIGDAAAGAPPTIAGQQACATGALENSISLFQANGLLGIGHFLEDCGTFCQAGPQTFALYYTCPTTACTGVAMPTLANQIINPVAAFAADNNGVTLDLPAVSAGGAATLSGTIYFGVATQSDNAPGASAQWLTVSAINGTLATTFAGTSLPNSFVDSGSNGYFFASTTLTACTLSVGFYCPASPVAETAVIIGLNGVGTTINFTVASADGQSAANSVLPGLAGNNSSPNAPSNSFDWGLPFFYGRRVSVLFESAAGPSGSGITGPAIAF